MSGINNPTVGGITQLTGDVTAGPGSGSQAASLAWITRVAGKSLTLNNILTLAGTDSTTMTFPTTSATIARTDAGQTFTGAQVISAGNDATALTISGTSITGSGTTPFASITGTWNTSGAPTAIFANITSSASAAGSLLMDLQVGGATQFNVSKSGGIIGQASATMQFYIATATSGSYRVGSAFISSPGAATWQFGLANAASPVAQTLQAQGAITGNNNGAATFTQIASLSVGNGTSGDLVFQTGKNGNGSGVLATATTALTIKGETQRVTAAKVFNSAGLAFASLPTGVVGDICYITDSNTTTWGATIAGSSTNKVLGWFNGTNWTVVGV